jgi:hypothetical protein
VSFVAEKVRLAGSPFAVDQQEWLDERGLSQRLTRRTRAHYLSSSRIAEFGRFDLRFRFGIELLLLFRNLLYVRY